MSGTIKDFRPEVRGQKATRAKRGTPLQHKYGTPKVRHQRHWRTNGSHETVKFGIEKTVSEPVFRKVRVLKALRADQNTPFGLVQTTMGVHYRDFNNCYERNGKLVGDGDPYTVYGPVYPRVMRWLDEDGQLVVEYDNDPHLRYYTKWRWVREEIITRVREVVPFECEIDHYRHDARCTVRVDQKHWYHPNKEMRRIGYHGPRRRGERDDLNDMRKDFNTNGFEDFDADLNDQYPRGYWD